GILVGPAGRLTVRRPTRLEWNGNRGTSRVGFRQSNPLRVAARAPTRGDSGIPSVMRGQAWRRPGWSGRRTRPGGASSPRPRQQLEANQESMMRPEYDVIVIGGGHAGGGAA